MIKENIEKKLADFKERHEYHCDEIKSHKSLRDHYRRKIEKLEAILTDKANT